MPIFSTGIWECEVTAFTTTRKVLFQHCDPAGIVFYPRYFEMINSVVEEWFEERLDHSFATLHLHLKKGVPTAGIAVDFRAPSRLGEVLEFTLTPGPLGRSRIPCRIEAWCDGQLRLEGTLTLVYVDGVTLKSEALPDALVSRIVSTPA